MNSILDLLRQKGKSKNAGDSTTNRVKRTAKGIIRKSVGLCPICDGVDFQDYKNREGEYCVSCGSKSRTRLMFMGLRHFGLTDPKKSILHFAPEPGLRDILFNLHGEDHVVADFDPDKLSGCANKRKEIVDLCHPQQYLLQGEFDALIHSHVFEHIPCNWALAFLEIHQSLKPDGIHFFSIPLNADHYSEDLSPSLTGRDRHKLFGQFDHLRNFGRKDFPSEVEKLARLTGKKHVQIKGLFDRDALKRHRAGGAVYALV